jgi:pullulanase/glycogen debranching enzyme
MEWDHAKQDRELYDFYRMMIALRKKNKALREGKFRILQACENDPCIVYERADEIIHFTVWMNNSPQPRTLSHPMETDDWQDALTGEPVTPDHGMMNISLDPYGYRILSRDLV